MFNKLLEAASYASLSDMATGIKNMIQKILGPVLIVIGVMAVVYAIYLGVMYAKAEDGNKRKEVQGRLIGALIGAVIIIVGITGLIIYIVKNKNTVKEEKNEESI